MVGYDETWDSIAERLRAAHRQLNVAPTNIDLVAFEEKLPMKPPFVLIGMIPGDFTGSIGGSPIETRATVEIFCATAEGKTNVDRIKGACRLARTVQSIIDTWEADRIIWGKAPLLLDTVTGEYAATSLQFSIPYTP
jgi:hypothetical protein